MDAVTYALLSEKIANSKLAYTYKGSVDSTSDLPDDATLGDMYTVDGEQYVWDGTNWIVVNDNAITNEQIDALFVI